jgi:hypothetical protein
VEHVVTVSKNLMKIVKYVLKITVRADEPVVDELVDYVVTELSTHEKPVKIALKT